MGLVQLKASICTICNRVFKDASPKMARPQKIMERYTQADGFQRLCLWLDHRDLRRDFDAEGGMWDK